MKQTGLVTKGFTLIELLIAIAVFSVLAIMSYGTLSNVLMAQNQTSDVSEKLYSIQQTILYLERDILQMVNRSIRDTTGTSYGAVEGGEYGNVRLEFSRTGRPNPNYAPRSYLQRISYAMPDDEEHKLYRYVWPQLDRSHNHEPHKMLLLDNVEQLVLRFYDDNGEELTSWPPLSQTTGQPGTEIMPRAIKISLKIKGMGEIWRLLEVPKGNRP